MGLETRFDVFQIIVTVYVCILNPAIAKPNAYTDYLHTTVKSNEDTLNSQIDVRS